MGTIQTRPALSGLPPEPAELWRRLCDYRFDEGDGELPFVRRLARENGWTTAFAHRVIDEYRRFLFLAATGDTPVTPSDQVDQAWHLHLTYTRAYWTRLCRETLGTPVHHGPTRGGRDEARKFDTWYTGTLRRYAETFGEPPPADIWPDPSVRFGVDVEHRRVNTARHWVIPKPIWLGRASRGRLALTAAGTLAALLATGPGPTSAVLSQFEIVGTSSLAVILGLVVCIVALVAVVRQRRCPECGTWSFRPNGFTDDVGRRAREEWECEDCGHRAWRRLTGSGGCGCGDGGDGCGGCGGCGD